MARPADTEAPLAPAAIQRLPLPARLFGHDFYYGWYIVVGAFIAAMMSMGVQAYTLGVFLKPMTEELGWSRTDISFGQTITTVATGFMGVVIGRRLDSHGARALMVGGAIIGGFGFMALGAVQELWQYYVVRAGLVAIGSVGMGGLVVNVAVSNWFVRRRGRAIAIGMMGTSVAALLLPTASDQLIDAVGWRSAWVGIGLAVWVLVIPTAWLVMRRRPEDFGLQPDGGPAPPSATPPKHAPRPDDIRWTRREAARTPALWMLILTFGLASTGLGAMLLHLISYLTDSGFSRGQAAAGFGMIGVSGLLSKPFWGLALERFPVRTCASAEFLLMALGIALILSINGLAMMYASIFVLGLGIGGVVTVQEVVWAEFFGRLTLGAVRSLAQPFTIISSAGGPVFAGLAYDLGGSYRFAFLVFIATYVVAAGLILLTPYPKRPESEASTAPPPSIAAPA